MKALDQTKINQLIRLAADDEMTFEEHRQWDAYLAGLDESGRQAALDAIEFERHLREAVAKCMRADGTVPIDLPIHVQNLMVETEPIPADDHHVDRRWFVPSGLAAGILFIISASLIVGILGNRNNSGTGSQPNVSHTDPVWAFQTIRSTEDFLNTTIDSESLTLPMFDELDYRFVGANPVSLDGQNYGVMAVYLNNSTAARIRLWIQPADDLSSIFSDEAQLIDGQAFRIEPSDQSDGVDSQYPIGAYAWVHDNALLCLRLEKVDSDQAQSMAIDLAHHAEMPDGQIVSISPTF